MCILLAEIIMFGGGLYALIVGKIRLTKNVRLEGWRARVAGVILALPLPSAFLLGLVIGTLSGARILPPEALGYISIIELLLVLGGLIAAAVFGVIAKPKEEELVTPVDDDFIQIDDVQ